MPRSTTSPYPVEEKLPPVAQSLSLQAGKRYADLIADKDLFIPSRSRAMKEIAPVATIPLRLILNLLGWCLLTREQRPYSRMRPREEKLSAWAREKHLARTSFSP